MEEWPPAFIFVIRKIASSKINQPTNELKFVRILSFGEPGAYWLLSQSYSGISLMLRLAALRRFGTAFRNRFA